MKNKIKTLLIASMCMAMAVTSVPVDLNLFNKTTVEAATGKNGLYHEGNDWNYYVDDNIAAVTTLVKYNGSWWYVNNGKVDFSARTLIKYNGTWFFVENGKVNFSARTVVKYNGTWFFVEHGKVNFSARTVVKYNGSWWYIKNGKIDFSASDTLVKYNGSWWYIKNGRIDFSSRTLCKYNGSWWFVEGGRVNFNAETVCEKYTGNHAWDINKGWYETSIWWYVRNGKVDFNAHGLCKYAGNWWYIDNGRINFSGRALVKYNGSWWLVENGKVNFNSGHTTCNYNGTLWDVNNGRMTGKASITTSSGEPKTDTIFYDNLGLPYMYIKRNALTDAPGYALTAEYKERRQRLLDVREVIGYLPDRQESVKGGMTMYMEVMTCYGSKYVVMCMPQDFCDMNNGIDLNARGITLY